MGAEALGARREKRKETGSGGGGAQARRTPSPLVGERGGVRTVAQQPEGDDRSGIEKPGEAKEFVPNS